MEGGIIAAGLGSRFQEAGFSVPKPLIELGNKPLLAWTLDQFINADISKIHIIFRTAICKECKTFLLSTYPQIQFTFVCKDTQSSAESFLTLLKSWDENKQVLVTTVDSIYRPGMLKRLREQGERGPKNALYLGITSYIEDEKPLYVDIDSTGLIRSLGNHEGAYVTSGAYLLPTGFAKGRDPSRYKALRAFLKEIVSHDQITSFGINLGKVFDIDRPEDLDSAQGVLQGAV